MEDKLDIKIPIEQFKKFIKLTSNVDDVITLKINASGISILQLAPSGITMLEHTLPSKLFPKYNVPKEQLIDLSADLLKKDLKGIKEEKNGTEKYFEIKEEESNDPSTPNKLKLFVDGKDLEYSAMEGNPARVMRNNGALSKLYEGDAKYASLAINKEDFVNGLRFIKKFTEKPVIDIKDGKLTLFTPYIYEQPMHKVEIPVAKVLQNENVRTEFNGDLFKSYIKDADKKSPVIIQLKNNEPARIKLISNAEPAQVYIAPIRDDDIDIANDQHYSNSSIPEAKSEITPETPVEITKTEYKPQEQAISASQGGPNPSMYTPRDEVFDKIFHQSEAKEIPVKSEKPVKANFTKEYGKRKGKKVFGAVLGKIHRKHIQEQEKEALA